MTLAPKRIVTVSFTPRDAGGGVPKFNRDIHSAFPDRECVHYSWWDFPWCTEMEQLPEWEKARTLNHYLVASRKLTTDDVVIADGFWADGLDHLPLAISHSHGIWGHVTKDDVDRGVRPENPLHHIMQVEFRRRWIGQGKHITAVSEFIAEQMRLQWGFKVDRVIDNGVDTSVFVPFDRPSWAVINPLIIHGVNDRGNLNKGWDHIDLLSRHYGNVFSLDEAMALFPRLTKAQVLSRADLVVHPSGFEGNSMFVAEALSCGIPIVCYDVGFAWKLWREPTYGKMGIIIHRSERTPERTLEACREFFELPEDVRMNMGNRAKIMARDDLSIERFKMRWRSYVEEIENA